MARQAEEAILYFTTVNPPPSIFVKFTYDSLRELMQAMALADGVKAEGEGAHIDLIEYFRRTHPEFGRQDIEFLNFLRELRHDICYKGHQVTERSLERKKVALAEITRLVREAAKKKLA